MGEYRRRITHLWSRRRRKTRWESRGGEQLTYGVGGEGRGALDGRIEEEEEENNSPVEEEEMSEVNVMKRRSL